MHSSTKAQQSTPIFNGIFPDPHLIHPPSFLVTRQVEFLCVILRINKLLYYFACWLCSFGFLFLLVLFVNHFVERCYTEISYYCYNNRLWYARTDSKNSSFSFPTFIANYLLSITVVLNSILGQLYTLIKTCFAPQASQRVLTRGTELPWWI